MPSPTPTLPADEPPRLGSISPDEIVDDDTRKAIDDLLGLAAYICETPIALVSLAGPGEPTVIVGVGLDPGETVSSLHSARRFCADAPLLASGGQVLGHLWVADRRPRSLNAEQQQALHRLGRQGAHLLQLGLANARIRRLSVRDELTGLPNRRGFMPLAEQHLRHAARLRRPVLLMRITVEGTQSTDDGTRRGEEDQAARDAAGLLRGVFRDCDVPARWDEGTFVVCVPDASEAAVPSIQRRLEAALRAYNARDPRGTPLAVSLGTACCDPSTPRSIDALLAVAETRSRPLTSAHM